MATKTPDLPDQLLAPPRITRHGRSRVGGVVTDGKEKLGDRVDLDVVALRVVVVG